LYRHFERRLAQHLAALVRRNYQLDLAKITIEQPPRVELGDYALPLAFELAKRLRKPPRKIAEEIVQAMGPLEGFSKFELAGAGYINARLERAELALALAADRSSLPQVSPGKVLVEHSSINPNKAAHVGHLRNAILGDTFVRLLRFSGRTVDVQNYIDNTGVQVADVVVGFLYLEKRERSEIESLAHQARFDYYCWDLYARVSQWYEQDRQNQLARQRVLHAIEEGGNETAAVADLIATSVLRRHLETMQRLAIAYDFLPRESEILHLHFWDAAFSQLRDRGVLLFETEGKNKGCWVMRRAGTRKSQAAESQDGGETIALSEEEQKVIVRSNGTVGYVGKDIAYHMWKFGVLGRDFGYRRFYRYPSGHDCWISATTGEAEHPHFGEVREIYNVVDARQSEAQNTVMEALRSLGYAEQADHFTHFSYEMVVLTPQCAAELGYQLSEEDRSRAFIEVSGRKGFGVKADDLMDALMVSAKKEVDARHGEWSESERTTIATQIALGAVRYFMLKFTKSSVIAFDFKEALSFEGETGPYAQYAVVRATNIFRKGGLEPEEYARELLRNISREEFSKFLGGAEADELWELWLAAAKTSAIVDQAIATTEPAYVAKHVFQLAQLFNTFYHRYPILTEADASRKRLLLATVTVVRRELIRLLSVLGITIPPMM
jgi:arginyl-tRNA synthetase